MDGGSRKGRHLHCVFRRGGQQLLLKLACDAGKAAGVPIWAVTFSTKLHPHGELEDARQAAAELGAEHIVLEVDERSQEGIQNNPPDRCYICKEISVYEPAGNR